MKRAFIGLTEEQRNLLRPVFLELSRNGGAIMAQVFTDGIHVVLLPDDIATRVAGTVGVDYLPKINSGFKAFSDGIERDKKGGAA